MAKIVAALYLILMLLAGWRLFGMGWSRGRKIAAGLALVCPLPLVLLLPPLIHPERPFADLLRAIALTLLLCGGLCLLGGMSAAWLRSRRS